jgi:uncharacterized protein YoaH (UPF0181 family)
MWTTWDLLPEGQQQKRVELTEERMKKLMEARPIVSGYAIRLASLVLPLSLD